MSPTDGDYVLRVATESLSATHADDDREPVGLRQYEPGGGRCWTRRESLENGTTEVVCAEWPIFIWKVCGCRWRGVCWYREGGESCVGKCPESEQGCSVICSSFPPPLYHPLSDSIEAPVPPALLHRSCSRTHSTWAAPQGKGQSQCRCSIFPAR